MTSEDTKYVDYDLVTAVFRYTVATMPNMEQIIRDFTSVFPTIDNIPSLEDFAMRYNNNRWISVKDRLPEENGPYLCCTKFINIQFIKIYFYGKIEDDSDRKCFYFFDSEYGDVEDSDVTHWMALPKLPKLEECR